MPRKKASRAPSRAKPTIPNDSITVPDMKVEEQNEKMRLLLKDFDAQVEERIFKMEKEVRLIQESLSHMYKNDLRRYSEEKRNMLWIDYIKVNKDTGTKSAMRDSVASILGSADDILASAMKKGRRKGKTPNILAPPSATRTGTRANRQKTVLGESQTDNMQPPPSTARVPRSRKMNLEVTATPANQGINSSYISSMIVTPKFDPRTPLPPGTIKRKPKLGEVAISLTGSPLQVSPKGWISSITSDNLDEETRVELMMFHERVGKLLKM